MISHNRSIRWQFVSKSRDTRGITGAHVKPEYNPVSCVNRRLIPRMSGFMGTGRELQVTNRYRIAWNKCSKSRYGELKE